MLRITKWVAEPWEIEFAVKQLKKHKVKHEVRMRKDAKVALYAEEEK